MDTVYCIQIELEMGGCVLRFLRGGNTDSSTQGKNLLEQKSEQTSNTTHIWRPPTFPVSISSQGLHKSSKIFQVIPPTLYFIRWRSSAYNPFKNF